MTRRASLSEVIVSATVMAWVFTLDVTADQQQVLLALADHAHDDGSSIYPSVGRLAWKTNRSERTVQRILRSIEQEGLLVLVANADGGRGRAREYRLAVGTGRTKAPYVPPKGDTYVTLYTPETVTPATPFEPVNGDATDTLSPIKGDAHDTVSEQKGDIPGAKGCQTVHKRVTPVTPQTSVETSEKHQTTTTTARETDELAEFVNETAEAFLLAPWMNVPADEVTARIRRSFGLVKGFDPRDGPLEAENFVTWFAKKPPESWYRAWLNWLKKAVRYEQEQQSRTNANPDRPRPNGEPARAGRTSAGSTAGAAGVDAGIAERGYSYDEIARRRAEASRARQDRGTAAGGGAGT